MHVVVAAANAVVRSTSHKKQSRKAKDNNIHRAQWQE